MPSSHGLNFHKLFRFRIEHVVDDDTASLDFHHASVKFAALERKITLECHSAVPETESSAALQLHARLLENPGKGSFSLISLDAGGNPSNHVVKINLSAMLQRVLLARTYNAAENGYLFDIVTFDVTGDNPFDGTT